MTALKNTNLDVIILAAGLGTRMKSATIKILHRAAGRPIIEYVLDLAAQVSDRSPIMVVGHQREAVQASVGDRARFAVQESQKGTGHAVLQAAEILEKENAAGRKVLILSGDVPLTHPQTLQRLIDEHEQSQNALTLLTMKPADPGMYGRVVRDAGGAVIRIVEAKDATDEEKQIGEVNAGIYVFDS
ncbi:MAG TPA: sugar phosphate nucleotidyltransferase, partial [Thermoanaerobaculia bacterium]|nr:sugar phosphate nucleotidyltransferase [Thermoanaerobaculia bacterium]